MGLAAAGRRPVSLYSGLTEQLVVWRARLAVDLPRPQGATARGRKHQGDCRGAEDFGVGRADGPVVVLSGEADPTTTELLREMLATQLGTGARLVTIDASELSFLDSASLRVLVLAARALHARHGTLVFACPQPVVARLLEITGADRLLDVQESARLAGSVNDGPTGRTDPAWADPDGYDPSC
jgi:anti-sigma B factor antagonist